MAEEWPGDLGDEYWCRCGGYVLITVTRTNKSYDGAYGVLAIDTSPFKCVTLENITTLIPVGVYDLRIMWSNHFQQLMPHVIVPKRDAIEIHWANFPVQLDGCTALGTAEDFADDMIEQSKAAWINFAKAITDQPALKIRYAEDYQ